MRPFETPCQREIFHSGRLVRPPHSDQIDLDCTIPPGPKPELFFAPGQIVKRTKEWGPAGLQERIGAAWTAFRDSIDAWLEVKRGYGREAVESVY